MGILDFFFPTYCVSCKKIGSFVCAECFAKIHLSYKTMCLVCQKGAIDGKTHPYCLKKYTIDGSFICYEYVSVIKKLVYVFKYQPYVFSLEKFLSELFYDALIQKEVFMHLLEKEKDILFMPVPLHKQKLRVRGYNHAALLVKNLAKVFEREYSDMLVRVKETKVQAGLTKSERKENMKGAFSLKFSLNLSGKTIYLVDDIVTTGSTFLEAATVLKKAGAKAVYGVAFSGEY